MVPSKGQDAEILYSLIDCRVSQGENISAILISALHLDQPGFSSIMLLKQDFGFSPKILIVEDDPVTSELIATSLQHDGITAVVCDSVTSIEAKLDEGFDIAILDLELPDGTGFDILARMQARPSLNLTSTIFLTGSDDPKDVLKAFEAGADDYVLKPFNLLVLRAKIATLLRIKRQAHELVAINSELHGKNIEIEAALKAESRFLSNMSHEIRNPLNGVIGLIDAALTERDPVEQKILLNFARSSGDQLRHIVDDILDLKMMDAGTYRIDAHSFDYYELRKTWIEPTLHLSPDAYRRVVVETDTKTIPRFFIGDPARLTQITQNFLSNAMKFTPTGGSIALKATYDYETGELTMSCKDSGIGMSPDTMKAIFNPFKQASDGTTKNVPGAGLGLSIVKGIVERIGGRISVESELGKGSTFSATVPLPVDWDRENEWRAGKLKEAVQESRTYDLSGLRVLCVDDSGINLKVVSKPLRKQGATVTTATSGQSALELVKSQDFDIVVTDISMPEMDGEELQQNIQQIKGELPVVALTGNVLKEDVERYLANGFVDALGKPLEIDKLYEVVSRHALRQ